MKSFRVKWSVAALAAGAAAAGLVAPSAASATSTVAAPAVLASNSHVATLTAGSLQALAINTAGYTVMTSGKMTTINQAIPKTCDTTACSLNWSGLAGTTNSFKIKGARATWTVPKVAASPAKKYSSTWVGVDGLNNTDLIQTGTTQQTKGTKYWAWWEILPRAAVPIVNPKTHKLAPVKPGDHITAYVEQSRAHPHRWWIHIADTTRHWVFNKEFTYTGPGTSAEWIEERPEVNGSLSALADFHKVTISHIAIRATVKGKTAWYVPGLTNGNRIAMLNNAENKVIALPGKPSKPTKAGQKFTDVYK